MGRLAMFKWLTGRDRPREAPPGLSEPDFQRAVGALARQIEMQPDDLWRGFVEGRFEGTLLEMKLDSLSLRRYGLQPPPPVLRNAMAEAMAALVDEAHARREC
jgi:hypothetical protein